MRRIKVENNIGTREESERLRPCMQGLQNEKNLRDVDVLYS